VLVVKEMSAQGRTEDLLHIVFIAASSEAAQNLSLSQSMQHFHGACLQIDLNLRGVHSRARNGVEASICYQVTRSRRGLHASHTVLAHHSMYASTVVRTRTWYVLSFVRITATEALSRLDQYLDGRLAPSIVLDTTI
jgi:hypothetical protein